MMNRLVVGSAYKNFLNDVAVDAAVKVGLVGHCDAAVIAAPVAVVGVGAAGGWRSHFSAAMVFDITFELVGCIVAIGC